MDAVVADFNEDGQLDIAGAGWGTYGALRVWLGEGTGGWQPTEIVAKGSFYRLTPADINRDGHLDIIAGTYRNGVRIFLGDGRGTFQENSGPGQIPETQVGSGTYEGVSFDKMTKANSYWQALLLDLSGDGSMELIAGSPEDKGLHLWQLSSGNEWVKEAAALPETGTFYDLVAADTDGDGYEEILAASYGEGIKVWDTHDGRLAAKQVRMRGRYRLAAEKPVEEHVTENQVFVMMDGEPQYKIGPRDVLEITHWQGVEGKKEEIQVTADGKISFGFVDDLYVAGLTERQLDRKITTLMARYIKNPSVSIRVKEYRSHHVLVLGAVERRGRTGEEGKIYLTGRTTVLGAISLAGGPRLDANLGDIRVRSKRGQSTTLNLFKTMVEGDQSQNIPVDDEDMIYVPQITKEDNRVYVFGEVEKPGIVTFKGGKLSMFDAIAQAGGVTIFAHEEDTRIVRGDISQPEVILANYEKLVEEGDYTQNIDLINGDLVYVPRSAMGSVNRFVKRIKPLMELIYIPGRIARDIEDIENSLKR